MPAAADAPGASAAPGSSALGHVVVLLVVLAVRLGLLGQLEAAEVAVDLETSWSGWWTMSVMFIGRPARM